MVASCRVPRIAYGPPFVETAPFQFQKRSQQVIGSHDEPAARIAAVSVYNEQLARLPSPLPRTRMITLVKEGAVLTLIAYAPSHRAVRGDLYGHMRITDRSGGCCSRSWNRNT